MSSLLSGNNLKRLIAAIIFSALGLYLSGIVPTTEIAWVIGILLLTIYLFVFEIVDVDVAAVSIMVLLGLTALIAPWMGIEHGLVDNKHLFDGFGSNAVMSIVAVMIIGAGLDKTGLMSTVASFILKVGGKTETRIIPIISGTVAIISSFMQNVGAAALFLPVVSRISSRSGLPMSRLLMPMGFCAILGGTITMVGSSPLILLNDLILTSNKALPAAQQMETWSLFSVTPLGLVMVAVGIVYFIVAGRFVLPTSKSDKQITDVKTPTKYFKDTYGVDYRMSELVIPFDSHLIGLNVLDIEHEYKIRIIAVKQDGQDVVWPNRETEIEKGHVVCVVASPSGLEKFSEDAKAEPKKLLEIFSEIMSPTNAGIAEVVIPPGSQLIGKSCVDVWMRKTYGLAVMAIHRNGETIREGSGVRDTQFQAGDTLVGYIPWIELARLEKDRNFVVVTTEYPRDEELRPHKVWNAGVFFVLALYLVIFTDLRLSVSLLAGALGMILSGVLKIEEAYEAVSWKTVFLLASLIPLGLAVETSGTAKYIAEQTLLLFGENPVIWHVQLAIAVLATFFTLVMSNVGATVLLVPLAVNIAIGANANPAIFALTVAIATSNSFLIPTHQVNALIMGPGGYRVPDYMRAGGIMTILFLVVMMIMMNVLF